MSRLVWRPLSLRWFTDRNRTLPHTKRNSIETSKGPARCTGYQLVADCNCKCLTTYLVACWSVSGKADFAIPPANTTAEKLSSQEGQAHLDAVSDLQDQVTLLMRQGTSDMQQRIQRTASLVVGRLVRLATEERSQNAYMVVLHNILIVLSKCNAKHITRAGSFLHAAGILHRYIRPSYLFLSANPDQHICCIALLCCNTANEQHLIGLHQAGNAQRIETSYCCLYMFVQCEMY